jgi:hypothetical protein
MQDQVNATPAPKRVPWNKGKLTTRRHNRATQIRLRFISISRSRRKLRPRNVRRL